MNKYSNKIFLVLFILSLFKITIAQKSDSVVYRSFHFASYEKKQLKKEIIFYSDSTFQFTSEFIDLTLKTSGNYSYSENFLILNSFEYYKDTIIVFESKSENKNNNNFYAFDGDKICLLEINKNLNILNDTIFLYYYDENGYYHSILKETQSNKNVIGFKIFKNDTYYFDYFLKNSSSNSFSFGVTPIQTGNFYIKNQKCKIEGDTLIFILYHIDKLFLVK